jgi:ABC-type amino acid transport substrate-binding protein
MGTMRTPSFASALLALLALLAAGVLASCASHQRSDPDAILVACDFDNPPFAGFDEHGFPVGRDVEMMEAIAARLQKRVAWVKMPFDELLNAVERGVVDAACATLGVTEERSRRVAFSTPYYETFLLALVRAGEGEPTTLEELHGKRVAASLGTTAALALAARLSGAVAIAPPSATKKAAPQRLLDREIDAAILDGPNALAAAATSGGRLAVVREALAAERYSIAIRRDLDELRAEIDRAIEELRGSGELDRLDREHDLPPSMPVGQAGAMENE